MVMIKTDTTKTDIVKEVKIKTDIIKTDIVKEVKTKTLPNSYKNKNSIIFFGGGMVFNTTFSNLSYIVVPIFWKW
jgi:predicted methyltransferase